MAYFGTTIQYNMLLHLCNIIYYDKLYCYLSHPCKPGIVDLDLFRTTSIKYTNAINTGDALTSHVPFYSIRILMPNTLNQKRNIRNILYLPKYAQKYTFTE